MDSFSRGNIRKTMKKNIKANVSILYVYIGFARTCPPSLRGLPGSMLIPVHFDVSVKGR